jgi:glycosyltransferase involved in cell wall biosynthesis
MKRFNVLFITKIYPLPAWPVRGIFVREHAKAVSLYHDVRVLHYVGRSGDVPGLWRIERELDPAYTANLPTYRAWERRVPIPQVSYLFRLLSVIAAFRRFAREGFRPDLIHANLYPVGLPAWLAGRLHRIPVVITVHSSEFRKKTLTRWQLWGARFAMERADVVMPVSEDLQRAMEAYGIRAPYRIVPNALDIDLFTPKAAVERGAQRRILFIGALESTHKKGVGYLFQALRRVSDRRQDWHLDLIGDGPTRPYYEHLAQELGIAEDVTFHGIQPKSEVVRYLHRCDFLVSSSLYETFGVVLIEAMAAGRPVIATQCGGPEEIVNDAVGVLVPPKDVAALAEAIDDMLDHAREYDPAQLSAYAHQRYSYQAVGAKLDAIYRSVVAS